MNQIRLILMCLLGLLFLGPGSLASCPSPHEASASALKPGMVVVDGCISSMPAPDGAIQTSIAAPVHRSTMTVAVGEHPARYRVERFSPLDQVTAKTPSMFDPLRRTMWGELPSSVTANDMAGEVQLASLQH